MDGNEDALSKFKLVGQANKEGNKGRISHRRLKDGQWSMEYSSCVSCGTTDSRHIGNGLCKLCFNAKQQLDITKAKNQNLSKNGVESIDFVVCQECHLPFECLMSHGHLREHGMTEASYRLKYGAGSTRPAKLLERTGNAISAGRHKLMETHGYLNPKSMRDNKRIELSRLMSEARNSKTSSIEETVSQWFSDNGFCVRSYDQQVTPAGDGVVVYRQFPLFRKYVVDFAIPSHKIVIEVLGTFWHGWDFVSGKKSFEELAEAAKKNVCTDKVRMSEIAAAGWTFVELWEHDVNGGKTAEVLSSKIPKSNSVVSVTNIDDPESVGLVSAKTIASSTRRLYNLRWFAGQNGITILPGLTVTPNELEVLSPLVNAAGDGRAVPASIMSDEFSRIREQGFPYYKASNNAMVSQWLALKDGKVTQKSNGLYLWDGFGTDLASAFHPHMFECRKKGKMSPVEFFENDAMLEEAIYKALCLYGTASNSKMRDICRNDYKSSRVNNFPPKVAVTIARVLCKNASETTVLDPCAGFGGRMLGFSAAGIGKYVGIDLSERTFEGLKKESEFLKKYGTTTDIQVIHADCISEMGKMLAEGLQFDLVMTSPPFVDREEYVGVPFKTEMATWIDEFMRPFISLVFGLLKSGGKFALYLGKTENKSNKLPGIADGLSAAAGFIQSDSIGFVTGVGESNRKRGSTRTTSVQVWTKP